MIELAQLRHLAAFHQSGTLSQAAEELHISQPALSRSMQKLEEELQVPLFERQKNKLRLNANGQMAVDLQSASVFASLRMKGNKRTSFSYGSAISSIIF